MHGYAMTIGGQEHPGSEHFPVLNPATEEVFAEAPECSFDDLERAVAAARTAFGDWRRNEQARRIALGQAADRLEAAAGEIAHTLTLEQGKPLPQAQGELKSAVAILKSASKMPLPHDVVRDDAQGRIEICHRPFGVVAAIAPWNFPALTALSKVAPALLAGNTCVLKPSPFTPLATLQLGRVLSEVLPAGVLNVISGGGGVGARLSAHPDVRAISFTGSVATGKKVAEAAAPDLKRVTLELGGNDPAIVLEDAPIEKLAARLFWSAFMNAGQVCLAIKRLYVAEPLFERLIGALTALARGVRVGDGLEPHTQMGPINNSLQLERVSSLVADARARGCAVRAGGERLGRKGYFYPPTVLADLGDDAPVVAEEQFGPVLPVLTYRDVDDAVERANATHFGLGASVWSADLERAQEIAKRLDAGTVWINQHMQLTPEAPFGGAKWSGLGYAVGRWGLESFLQKHVINLTRG